MVIQDLLKDKILCLWSFEDSTKGSLRPCLLPELFASLSVEVSHTPLVLENFRWLPGWTHTPSSEAYLWWSCHVDFWDKVVIKEVNDVLLLQLLCGCELRQWWNWRTFPQLDRQQKYHRLVQGQIRDLSLNSLS